MALDDLKQKKLHVALHCSAGLSNKEASESWESRPGTNMTDYRARLGLYTQAWLDLQCANHSSRKSTYLINES